MEATDGVELELSNGGLEITSTTDLLGSNFNMENKTTTNGADASEVNEAANVTLEDQLQADVGHVYEVGVKDSSAISENKVSNLSKKSGPAKGNNLKNTKAQKVQKDGAGQNGAVVAPKNPKTRLSQSLSFPAKSFPGSGLRKSTSAVKHTEINGNSHNANDSEIVSTGGTTARKSNNGAAGSTQQLLPVNSVSADDHTSEATPISPRTAVQRRSAPAFSFRLDERAEKRKEFFMKLEEKIHAKELENTNLQAKSKENQDAEIRQLRKTLTFKATPMPSFYQEASPPKVELKKIPPTRARSPKLGRNKLSSAAANNSLEEGNDPAQAPEIEPFSVKQNGGAANAHDSAAPKKTAIHKSISRPPPQKSAVPRPEAKLTASKTSKASNTNQKAEKEKAEENENNSENEIKQVEESPADAKIDEEVAEKEAESESIISSFLLTA